MKRLPAIFLCALSVVFLASCSTQKNTWVTRSYHQTKTKYNIYFNGNVAFEEGIDAIEKAHEDNFSDILPLYTVSNHKAAESATSQMDRTIEKCRKCIKLHSIKKKPKPNPKKRSDPEYKAWLQQGEFNKNMKEAWILLAKAEFHKGDFLGSVGTFKYIMRDFAYDKDVVARCQLWIVRAYAEMDWLYEAEDMFQKVKQDDLARKHAWLYAATAADLRLKMQQYKEAIPFLKLAVKDEKKRERARYYYVLGQIQEQTGDYKAALAAYKKVLKSTPAAEMDFAARMKVLQLEGDAKGLLRVAKQYKYRERLDQIYGAIGNIYMQKKDTTRALENYVLAIEKSEKAGMAKAEVLVKAGDIYYARRQYNEAQPCYTEAVSILTAGTNEYKRVSKRAETLDELIVEYNTVQLQDSLQRLSRMTEKEQLKVVEKLIADLEKAEKEAAEKAAQAAREAKNNTGLQSVNTQNMIGGGGGSGDWYFYNAQLLRSGKQTFAQQWGTRPLEDNWRRLRKTMTSTFADADEGSDEFEADSIAGDSIQQAAAPISDTKNPQYYLQQIPKTPADIAVSDSMIATALYNMVYIYQDKVGDQTLADETFNELIRRFPNDKRLVDLYYMQYLNCLKADNQTEAAHYRSEIMRLFPDTKQATIVSQPDYFERLQRMAAEQDSLYETTYKHFATGDYGVVKQNTQYAETEYPLSPLMPRFLFLNAVSVAKTDGQEAFVTALRDMVARYPESEVGAMAKDMLAMMNVGMESQKGDGPAIATIDRSSQIEEAVDTTLLERQFSIERREPAVVYIVIPLDENELNNLLYQVALFNFSQFLIKDFDLKQIPTFALRRSALEVSGFDSYDEALWYTSLILENADLHALFERLQADILPITESNTELLNTRFTIEEYKQFQLENMLH